MRFSYFSRLRFLLYDVLPPFGRAVIVTAALVVGAGGLISILRMAAVERRLDTIERAIATMDGRSYVRIGNRVFMRARDEHREEWALRVLQILNGAESEEGYLCTVLSGCSVPGGEIEVCTPCNSRPPSQACLDDHQADIDAFCTAFNCQNCPPAGG